MVIDPLYFVVQLILFPTVAILFGIFLHSLHTEIATEGWVVTPRCFRQICLCISSFSFCLVELDPSSVLGIIPSQWRWFMESIFTSFLLNSACSTFYMYIIVLSKRHLTQGNVPPLFTNLWIATNSLATLTNCLAGLIGGILDYSFFFGICLFVLMAQEVFIVGLVNVSLHKMEGLLRELEIQTSTNYKLQRRKMLVIRILATIIVITGLGNEFLNHDSVIYDLANTSPRPTRGFNPEVFDIASVVRPVLTTLAHGLLLYASQRPSESATQASRSKFVSFGEHSVSSSRSAAV